MKRLKKFLSASKLNVAVFILATSLVLTATFGAASAAASYLAETYSTRIQMYDIGISLLENGERISWRDYTSSEDGTWDERTGVLLRNMLGEGKSVQLGRTYPEELAIRNSGFINEYVRVEVRKYWLDAQGNKMQELSPDLIHLNLLCDETGHDNGWMLDKEASTPERTVLYYKYLLYAENEEGQGGASLTEAFSDTLTIDPSIATSVTQTTTKENGYTTITTTYDYDGVQFRIEVQAHGVQEHNAEDAAWSAWGRKVIVEDGVLTLP